MTTLSSSHGALSDRKGRIAVRSRLRPASLVWLALAAVLLVLVLAPISQLVIVSFTHPDTGAFTFQNYVEAYGRPRHVAALVNSLKMGAGTVALALLFAVPIAWACARTDMPCRAFARLAMLGAFITPPYLGAVGWILLAGPNAGWINRLWHGLTGATEPIVNIFSFWGLVLVMASSTFFLIFVFATTAFEMINSEMEDAANILGAGTLKTAVKITFPLVMPAILGGALLTFLISIALFGVPALISIPARYPVVVMQLAEFFGYPLQVEVAAAYSIPLLLITVALLGLQRLILARRAYWAVSGKGGERRLVRLGYWRWPMLAYVLIVAAITLVLPLSVLILAAFSKVWTAGLAPGNLTLRNFTYVLFEHSTSRRALAASIGLGAIAATAGVLLALGVAYVVQRRLLPGAGALAFLCLAPFVIPGIVLAIGFYAAYALPPLALYGTYTLLALALITRFLPIAFSASAAGIRSIHPEMEDAVLILGGGRLTAVANVVAPLLKRTLAGAWLLIFVPAAQELSTAVFLVGPTTRVVSVVLLDMSEEGRMELLAALGAVLLVIIVAVVALGLRMMGRDFMLRREL
ncbi:MAG: iron ABC transporter permease [Hyphomicrobiaceae bacterium]|nr:iron ABC transporter permease [Hyphomicrobiaceae bacterium]